MFSTVPTLVLTLAIFSFTHVRADEPVRRIAITFDDAPNASTFLTGRERAERLIAGLRDAGVPRVAFFANSVRMDEEGARRLRTYADAGHLIANHTHAHPDLNRVGAREFVRDIVAAEQHLAPLPNFRRWFRFPYLHEGDVTHKRDLVRAELGRLGYVNGYVTVNTYDWHLDRLYQAALDHGAPLNNFLNTYLNAVTDAAEYYDQLARDMLKRSPAHVLLLHENDLNAAFIYDLVQALRGAGWLIISPDEAYADPIARYETPTARPSNPGRIGEMALDHGFDFHPWHKSCDEEFLNRQIHGP